ncbi:MAG: membrane protein insertion efficiency factor YidD [Anaerolineae bacterium]|nr:membrane protein insertion efficiency factor YidD [Gloeobacterales cyanobacterium ES-bin-313]
MTANIFESFATQTAIASLNVYRTHISPRKGFSCPHWLLHGDESCSDYVKHILTNQNLSAAIQMAPQRFRACKAAAQTLKSQVTQSGCIVIPCCFPI